MRYPVRTLVAHVVLFFFVFVSFILPVVLGGSALVPVRLSGAIGIALSLAVLVDCARHFFAPAQARSRGLRILSGLGALAQIIGWAVWIYIYSNITSVGATPFRIGTFALSVGAVISLFVIAIAALDLRSPAAPAPSPSPRRRPRRDPRQQPR